MRFGGEAVCAHVTSACSHHRHDALVSPLRMPDYLRHLPGALNAQIRLYHMQELINMP